MIYTKRGHNALNWNDEEAVIKFILGHRIYHNNNPNTRLASLIYSSEVMTNKETLMLPL